MFIAIVVVVAVTMIVLLYGSALLIAALASVHMFWTTVQEGSARAILKNGKFLRAIMNYQGFELDKDGEVVCTSSPSTLTTKLKHHLFGGWLEHIRWIGFPPFHEVYAYRFTWVTTKKKEVGGILQDVDEYHNEMLRHVYVKHTPYTDVLTGAETSDLLQVDVKYVLTIRIVNPHKALFKVHRWLDAVLLRTQPIIRDYVKSNSYDETQKGDISAANPSLAAIFDEFKRDYCVEVVKLEVRDYALSGKLAKEHEEAATLEFKTKQEKRRTIIEAEGIAEAMQLKADAERKRRDVIWKPGQEQENLAAEALEKTAAGAGNTVLVSSPIGDILKSLLGGNKS